MVGMEGFLSPWRVYQFGLSLILPISRLIVGDVICLVIGIFLSRVLPTATVFSSVALSSVSEYSVSFKPSLRKNKYKKTVIRKKVRTIAKIYKPFRVRP